MFFVMPSYISGPKTCIPCSEVDADYSGNNIVPKISNVNSAEECRDHCLATPDCHILVFAPMWGECFLKDEGALAEKRTLEGAIAALMTC